MLEKFIGKRKVLLVPASWLNAVTSILNGIRSPKGTVSASLEGDGEGSNLRIDIVPSAAARELQDALASNFVRKNDYSLLGEGLKWGERGLTIDKDWFRREVVQGEKA